MSNCAVNFSAWLGFDDATAQRKLAQYGAALIAGDYEGWNCWAGYWQNRGVR